ncbi:restriction endonuclease subunit S [Haliea atlantica]
MTTPLDAGEARVRLIEHNEIPPLPSGWDVRRFRFLFRESKERNGETPVGDMLSVSEYRGVVPKDYEHEEQRRTDEELQTYKVVRPGQLAVNTMWLNHLGLGVSNHLGHVSPAYAVYDISKELDKRFSHHLLRSQYYLKIYLRYLYGIRPNSFQIKTDDWNSIPIILPPRDTQKAIADFLDHETARIDQLIEKKQRLVAILSERRTSVISKAVTVGLPEQKEAVESSSRFLPRVPVGWVVTRLKHLGRIRGGLTLGRTIPEATVTRLVPYLRVANVQAGWVDLSDVAEVAATDTEIGRYSLKSGDILMNEGGDNDKLGRGAVWHAPFEPCLNQNHVFVVKPFKSEQAEWISLATNAQYARDFFYFYSNQSTNLASISKSNLSEFPVAIPPNEEMRSILTATKRQIATLELLNQKTNNSLNVLYELRAALITAAVTGQIDVQTWGKQGQTDRRLDQIEEDESLREARA